MSISVGYSLFNQHVKMGDKIINKAFMSYFNSYITFFPGPRKKFYIDAVWYYGVQKNLSYELSGKLSIEENRNINNYGLGIGYTSVFKKGLGSFNNKLAFNIFFRRLVSFERLKPDQVFVYPMDLQFGLIYHFNPKK